MNIQEKDKKIEEYIDKLIKNMRINGISIGYTEIRKIKKQFLGLQIPYEEIINKIDELIDNYIDKINKKNEYITKLKDCKELNISLKKPFFGGSYSYQIISLFKIYEEINSNNTLTDEEKKSNYYSLQEEFIIKEKAAFKVFLENKLTNKEKIECFYNMSFKGFETLNYDVIGNLYNLFINEIDVVATNIESKMEMILVADKKIFLEDGSINKDIYDYSRLKEIFDFAKKHNKEIKICSLILNSSIPENLQKEINDISDNQKRKYLLNFINDYVKNIKEWVTLNNYKIRQIEAINGFATNDDNTTMYKDTFFSKNIGDNKINSDKYYIEILKIVRDYFQEEEIIISDYNEFDPSKSKRICTIVNDILDKSTRDKVTYLNGLGLQSHYSINYKKDGEEKELTSSKVYETMYDYKKLELPIYRTETDFNCSKDVDEDKYTEILFARNEADKYSDINGIIIWGNTKELNYIYNCYDNIHAIDSNGKPTEEFLNLKSYIAGKVISYNNNDKFNELEFIMNIIDKSSKGLKEESTIEEIYEKHNNSLDKNLELFSIVDESQKNINNDTTKSIVTQKAEHIHKINSNTKRIEAITRARESLKEALNIGCQTKYEIREGIKLITQIKLTDSPTDKEKYEKELVMLKNTLSKKTEKKKFTIKISRKKDKNISKNTKEKGNVSFFFNLFLLSFALGTITFIVKIVELINLG